MLLPEDCISGIKVICVLLDNTERPPILLSLGAEYTIRNFESVFWDEIHNELCFNTISLLEIPDDLDEANNTTYENFFLLKCFKLKNKKQHDNVIHEVTKKLELT